MPLDVDLANKTSINLNMSAKIDPSNPNQTTVAVNGNAGTYSSVLGGYSPLQSGSKIYIYYDTNMNYFNTTSTPISNPSGYYAWADKCAFSGRLQCTYANPLASITQGGCNKNHPLCGSNYFGDYLLEANHQNYDPQTTISGSGTKCQKQPKGLIQP
ncbi:hypothetical protein B1B_19463, partial [mine drainage metagenome]